MDLGRQLPAAIYAGAPRYDSVARAFRAHRIARFVLWPRFRSWSVHSALPIAGPTRPFGTPKIGGMRE